MLTREPGGSRFGEWIRELLLHRKGDLEICGKAEMLLFLAARAQHIEEVIMPSLQEDKIVLCDRFNDSTIAYQGFARGLGTDSVEALCNFVVDGLAPDMTFFLDVDPEVGLQRAARVGAPDRIEELTREFHARVRKGFLQLAEKYPKRIQLLDAHEAPDQVFQQALQRLRSLAK